MTLKGGFTHTMLAGAGYDTWSGGFARVSANTLVRVSDEYAKPGHAVCYNEQGERMHTRKTLLRPICSECDNPAGQCCVKENHHMEDWED